MHRYIAALQNKSYFYHPQKTDNEEKYCRFIIPVHRS